MGKLCISIHFITFFTPMHCIYVVAHGCIFAIDHVEQGRVEPPEPAPVEGADYEQDQGKPQCI
jgi:hypothetical protein